MSVKRETNGTKEGREMEEKRDGGKERQTHGKT
jgi:hypothetical protein